MSAPLWVEGLGVIAAIQTTFAFFPQALKVYKSKSAADISLPTFLMFTSGVVCWLVYGFLIASPPMIGANIITLFLALAIVVMKIRYG